MTAKHCDCDITVNVPNSRLRNGANFVTRNLRLRWLQPERHNDRMVRRSGVKMRYSGNLVQAIVRL